MCNHYQNSHGAEQLLSTWAEYIGWTPEQRELSELQGATDIWPKRSALVVRTGDAGAFTDAMQWGVPLALPGKREGSTITKHVTNVRNLSSPFWRSMLAKPAQRCLVPFTRFAEPKPNAGREEVWFAVKGAPVSAFAGVWRESDAGTVFAFLTCDPNPLIAPIHPKAMPVILHPGDYAAWLEGAPAGELASPFPSQLMAIVE